MPRRPLARVVLLLDALVCGFWAYWAATSMLGRLSGTGSTSSSRLAKHWRNAHLAALLALILLPIMGGLRVMMVSIVVMLPVQLFFVIGALTIWIEDRRTPSVITES